MEATRLRMQESPRTIYMLSIFFFFFGNLNKQICEELLWGGQQDNRSRRIPGGGTNGHVQGQRLLPRGGEQKDKRKVDICNSICWSYFLFGRHMLQFDGSCCRWGMPHAFVRSWTGWSKRLDQRMGKRWTPPECSSSCTATVLLIANSCLWMHLMWKISRVLCTCASYKRRLCTAAHRRRSISLGTSGLRCGFGGSPVPDPVVSTKTHQYSVSSKNQRNTAHDSKWTWYGSRVWRSCCIYIIFPC